jgi:hypothetical protein
MFGNQALLCQVVLPVRSCAAAIRPDRESGRRGAYASRRRRVRARLQDGARGHRVEAPGDLAQNTLAANGGNPLLAPNRKPLTRDPDDAPRFLMTSKISARPLYQQSSPEQFAPGYRSCPLMPLTAARVRTSPNRRFGHTQTSIKQKTPAHWPGLSSFASRAIFERRRYLRLLVVDQ